MAKYRKKPVIIEAITFDELVAHGKQHAKSLVNGMPWAFSYKGHPITHENDECYLISTSGSEMYRMMPCHMLITNDLDETFPLLIDIFNEIYEKITK